MIIKVHEHKVQEAAALTSYVIVAASGKYEDSDGRKGTLYDASTLVTTREFTAPEELVNFIYRKLKLPVKKCTVSERETSGEYCLEIVCRLTDSVQSYIVYIQGYEKREMPKADVSAAFSPVIKEG